MVAVFMNDVSSNIAFDKASRKHDKINTSLDHLQVFLDKCHDDGVLDDHESFTIKNKTNQSYKDAVRNIHVSKDQAQTNKEKFQYNQYTAQFSSTFIDSLNAFSKNIAETIKTAPKQAKREIAKMKTITSDAFHAIERDASPRDKGEERELESFNQIEKAIKDSLYVAEKSIEPIQRRQAREQRDQDARERVQARQARQAPAPQASRPSTPKKGFWKTFNAVGDFLGRLSNIGKAIGTVGMVGAMVWGSTSIFGKSDSSQQVTPGNTGIDHTINIADEKPDHSALHASQSDLNKVDTAHYNQGVQKMPAQQRAK